MQRRSFLGAILAAGCAPAIARAGILMPVKRIATGEEVAAHYAALMEHAMEQTKEVWIRHIGEDFSFFGAAQLKREGAFVLYDPYPDAPTGQMVKMPFAKGEFTLPPGWEFCAPPAKRQPITLMEAMAESRVPGWGKHLTLKVAT